MLTPPRTLQKPFFRTSHGEKREDPYAWLEEGENPEVIEHLKNENGYTDEFYKTFGQAPEILYQELKGRIKEKDMSVPVKIGPYLYYLKTEEGQSYPIYCRKKIISSEKNYEEEIILDQNALAQGKAYCDIGIMRVSPDHNLLAYSVDYTGGEVYDLYVKNLDNGKLLPDFLSSIDGSAEWSEDGLYIFYTTYNEAQRPYRLFRHKLGQPKEEDFLVYEEKNESLNIAIGKTRDREFLTLFSYRSAEASAVSVLSARQPEGLFRLVCPEKEGCEYNLDHGEDPSGQGYFYVRTNIGAVDFKLTRFPDTENFSQEAEEVIPSREGVYLEGVDVFLKHLVVYEKEKGNERVVVQNIKTGEKHNILLPEEISSISPGGNPEFDTAILRFSYTSLISPTQVVDYDMEKRVWITRKEEEVTCYDKSLYQSERIYATASDGKEIPISIVFRKDKRLAGSQPLFLYGYGAYGDGLSPYFSSNRISLLDRGVIVALAHTRGGDDLGRLWYQEGKLFNKKNSFSDFISCAECLFERGYTENKKLIISGGSAGGLLIGAAVVKRPDLCLGALLDVPFVDVLNTMENPSLPLTTIEYAEWGNPKEIEAYRYIKSYAPYENIKEAAYPAILTLTSFSDRRVPYWEAAKWTARLREKNRGAAPILLKIEMAAGHGGPSGRYSALRETALRYTFVLSLFGLLDR